MDDGTGVKIGKDKWFFAAYYAFRLWTKLIDVAEDLATLYTLTGDPAYAHKAGVLLDRMADLYPEMNYRPHYRLGMEASTGGSGKGRVQGCIWETWTAQKLSLAYDAIYDALLKDEGLVAFSKRMSDRFSTGDKSSPQTIALHIEDHLIREFIKGVRDGRIRGNEGMQQYSMAAAAIALDRTGETDEALDWLFEPNGGRIPYVLVELLSREGLSHESGLGYASIPARSFQDVAELLRGYERYRRHDLYVDYPKFRNCFTMCSKVRVLDRYSPNPGDSGKCMNMSTTGLTIPVGMALRGYQVYGGHDIAREAWFANGKKLKGIRGEIYDADPEAVLTRLKEDLSRATPPLRSYVSGGYGLAAIQAPWRSKGRAALLYFGRMAGHGHEDRLAIGLVAKDVVMAPDLGYPLYTGHWPKRVGWTSHIVSHNTCMVNDRGPDRSSYSGKTRLFAERDSVRVVDVDGGRVYGNVRTYRRCLVMVDVDREDSYVLDLFWVRGGRNHRLIQNGGGPSVTHQGLDLKKQARGTYAGEDIPYGSFYDGPSNWDYDGSGFMYLSHVEKSKAARDFWVDWKIVEPRRRMPEGWDAHLRVHNLSAVDEAALCDGIPPEYKGNPTKLRYLLRTRYGEDRETQFISVLEPYGGTPFIKSARALREHAGADGFAAAVEVVLANGFRDVILVTENGGRIEAAGVSLEGRVGLARFRDDEPILLTLVAGTQLRAASTEISLPCAAYTGRLASSDESDPSRTLLKLDTALPDGPLVGEYLLFENTERTDASFRIEERVDAHTLSIGCNSLVERFVDAGDYGRGVVRIIAPGDRYAIATSASWQQRCFQRIQKSNE